MPHDVTVDLGNYTILSNLDKNLVLTITASMSLSLAEEHLEFSTAAELREKVKAGSLWITRAGSCNFELRADFNDLPSHGLSEHLEHMVVDAFETFPAWSALGLDLRREYNRFHDLPSPNTPYPYSVQHAQQHSALVAPDDVPCAYLSTLSCRLSFGTDRNTEQGTPPKRKWIVTLKLSPRKLRRFAKRKVFDGQSWINSVSMGTMKASPPKLPGVTTDGPDIYTLTPDQQKKRLARLTHISLNSLLGLRKKYSGCQIQGRAQCPTLLEMAPAVWNARYFQDIVTRSQLAPVISSALCNLVSTKSPRVRQKVVDTTKELDRQLLVLILRSTRAPKISPRALRTIIQPLPIADSSMDIDEQNDEQFRLEVQESSHPSRNLSSADRPSLRRDAVLCAHDILQDNSLLCEIDPGVGRDRWHPDQQDFASSSSRHSPSFRCSPEVWDLSDIDLRFEEEQLHDAGRLAMQQKPYSSNMIGVYPEIMDARPHDENYLDEDYLEAEKELAEVLANGNLSSDPPPTRDYDDELFLETEQQLAKLLSLEHNTDLAPHEFIRDDLMDVNAGPEAAATDPMDREIFLKEPPGNDARGYGWGDENDDDDGLFGAGQYVVCAPTSSYFHYAPDTR